MAQHRTTEQRDQRNDQDRQQRQGAGTADGATRGGSATEGASRVQGPGSGVQGSDRERGIRTDRERGTTGELQRQRTPYTTGGGSSPFSLMRRMAEDMDRIFEDFGFAGPSFSLAPLLSSGYGQGLGGSSSSLARTGWMPQIETMRRGDELVVRADLPGLRKEDVHVEVDDGILTISGERHEESTDDRDDYYRSERSYGRFYRAIPLPDGVDENACDARFENGVLEVTIPLPKQQERKSRRIQIR
jgi:HSP20 family protein